MKNKTTSKKDTLGKYQNYIKSLYQAKTEQGKKEFIQHSNWKDFVPVVDDDTARFLQLMLMIKRPNKILEIGTSIGFSTLSMAFIAKTYGATITTIEFDKQAAEQAAINFKRAGVDKTIQMKFGDARQIIPAFSNNSFDFIFQDVDKRLYATLLNDCIRILKKDGAFVADDALFPVMDLNKKWSNQIEPIRQFNRLVVTSPALLSTLLPIGDGVMVAIKK